MSMPSPVWAVIPAYNEAPVIGSVVRDVLQHVDHVLVVNDGSTDSTAQCAAEGGAEIIHHPINRGQGAALHTGMLHARSHGAAIIVTFDADGQHDPRDIPALLAALRDNQADIALGSRFLGRAIGMRRSRLLLLRLAIAYTRLATGMPLTDTHNGLRALTANAARQLQWSQPRMAHASELLAQIAALKLRWVEVPCTIRYTPYSLGKGQRLHGMLSIPLDLLRARIQRLFKG